MTRSGKTRIGVFLDAVLTEDRDCLRGIAAFADGNPTWDFMIEPKSQDVIQRLRERVYDGVILRLDSSSQPLPADLRQELIGVNISGRAKHSPLPRVCNDNEAIGRMAAEYFLAREYNLFALFSKADHNGMVERKQGFLQAVGDAHVATFDESDQTLVEFVTWIKKVGVQVAVFCCTASHAKQLLRICAEQDISIPEQVSILGGTDDELQCTFSTPRLSSVLSNAYRIGYAGCANLAKQLAGEPFETETRIPPKGVVTRQSTDMLATQDTLMVSSLKFIRDRYQVPMSSEEVAYHVGVSRRTLDRKFIDAFGRSIKDEINRVRIESAKRLLVSTEEPMVRIAELCGYTYPERFSIVFKRITGLAPSSYRQRFRG